MSLLDELRGRLQATRPDTAAAAPADAVALAVLLLKSAHADGELAPAEERELLAVLRDEFALADQAAAGLLAAAHGHAQRTIEDYSDVRTVAASRTYAERLQILHLLLRVSTADGELSAGEERKLFQLAGSMHISSGDYGRVKGEVKAVLRNRQNRQPAS